MTKSKKPRVKRPTVPTPSSLDQAAEYVAAIGRLQRDIDTMQTSLNERVDSLTAQAREQVLPLTTRVKELLEGLYLFSEANRQTLTDGNKRKTVEVPTGQFGWRVTPPRVNVASISLVLSNLRRLGLTQFIRLNPEVDKEAMLKDPELARTVDGVSITKQEQFFVKPIELSVEITGTSKKLVT